ncbi:MAG TPA: TatD family hydrolase, partial [Terriglobales bacterium]
MDSHCHPETDAEIEAAAAAGVWGMVAIHALDFARRHDTAACRVWATLGIHPHEAAKATAAEFEAIAAQARDLKIVGVEALTFKYRSRTGRDDEGHAHPAEEHDAQRTILRVRTSIGVEGYAVGGSPAAAAVANRMIGGMN